MKSNARLILITLIIGCQAPDQKGEVISKPNIGTEKAATDDSNSPKSWDGKTDLNAKSWKIKH